MRKRMVVYFDNEDRDTLAFGLREVRDNNNLDIWWFEEGIGEDDE